MKMKKQIKKVIPHTINWEKKANYLARSYAPPIYACADCGNPVIDGYCCTFCNSNNPRVEYQDKRIEALEAMLTAWEAYNDGLITRKELALKLVTK